MNELDVLNLFYDEIILRGATREVVFLNVDEQAVSILSEKLKVPVSLEEVHARTDTCIANEWLERTTIDPGYNFLSLTEAGLQVVLANLYK